MDSRRRTPADLDVADLDKALLLISPEAAQEIRGFRNSLKNLQSRQRIEHCQRKRDDLLSCHKGLEAVFVCYGLVFQTCSIKKQGEAWDKFDEVVRSREASKCLKSLIGVSDVWGKEVIIHYGFLSQYRTYCDELHAIARQIPTWDEAVAILNQSIDQRIRKNDRRTRMKESSNPIERRDLAYVKAYVKTAKHRRPAFPGLLPGYGRDKYGLIVRAKFAEESRALSPLPSSSSQQLLDPKPTLGGDGYDGSTLVPSPLLPSSQQCSPSPSKAASVESNGPSPPPSPPLETSPSRPLLTSAWLSAVPLSLLDEGKWIDDRIVNAYMYVLAVKHPGTCFLNSHFLGQYGSEMKKWRPESGKHPLSSDFVLMPVNDKHHWSLLVMYKRFLTGTSTDEWVVCFLDSLGLSHEETFVCWENYLEACGNKLMVRKIDVKVPRQTNCTDCGVYVLGFAKEFLKKPWGFTDAVDRGKHLDWKISAPLLRKDIRAILAAVSDATTDSDKATGGDGCGDFGVCHGGAEITESLGDDVVNSDDEYRWECGNKGGEDDVDRKAESRSTSPPTSSIRTSSSPYVVEGVSDFARPISSPSALETPSPMSLIFDLGARAPAGRVSVPEERDSTIEDRLFTMFTTLLDQEQIDLHTLSTAVHRVLERVHHSQPTQVPAKLVDLPPRSAGLGADRIVDEVPGTIAGKTTKRKRRSDRKDKYNSHEIARSRFLSIQKSSPWGRLSGYLSSTDVQLPLYISQGKTNISTQNRLAPSKTPSTLISYRASENLKIPGTQSEVSSQLNFPDPKLLHAPNISSPLLKATPIAAGGTTVDSVPPIWDPLWQLDYNTGPRLQLAMQLRVSDTAPSIVFAMRGNIDGLKYLFSQGLASPKDVSNTRGYSLMRWALYGGMHQYETVKFLLSQGAYIDKDSYEHVCDFVLRGKCNEIEVQALRCITESEDRNWIEEQNFPLIHMIILGLSNKPLMEELVVNPGAVHAVDVQGRTALDWATARAQLQDMKLLIAHGSNLNTMDIDGRTTVLHAVDSHVEEALRIILKAGADPNPKMPEGLFRSSPLTSASFGGLAGMVRLLISYGADIGACNPEGRTALHWVASIQNAECAHILLEHGANIDQMSSNGHTPFTTAIIHNSHTVLQLFVDQYYLGSGKGPQLLPIIAEHADVETISILASSLVLKQCLSLSEIAAGWKTLQQRKDYDERLCHAFGELCYSAPLSALG